MSVIWATCFLYNKIFRDFFLKQKYWLVADHLQNLVIEKIYFQENIFKL